MTAMDKKEAAAENLKTALKGPGPERPTPSGIYPVIDNDLARDNLENDIPAADLNDL